MSSLPTTSRREFLMHSAALAAAVATMPQASAWARTAANDRINLGIIGIGPRCTYDVKAMLPFEDIRVTAIADVQASRRDAGKKLMSFLLSAEAQKALPDAYAVPARQDLKDAAPSAAGAQSPAQVIKNVEILHPEWTKVLDELDADVAAYTKATGS